MDCEPADAQCTTGSTCQITEEIDPDGKLEALHKCKRNFINDEILHIMEDEIRGK